MQFYADVMSLHFPVPLQRLGMRPPGESLHHLQFPPGGLSVCPRYSTNSIHSAEGPPTAAGPIRRGAGMQQVSISGEPRPVFVISKVLDSVDFAGLVKLVVSRPAGSPTSQRTPARATEGGASCPIEQREQHVAAALWRHFFL
jgi:hypothetical protein